ncbi:MAG: efflux RND transporter permease subunit [Pseudomonadota bacterium]
MGNIATASIERPLYTWLLIAACFFGGWYGIETVGRLEDPKFPIKNAFIITPYPGASALEVEQEVTDVIEAAIQELPYLDVLTSKSLPGRSEVQVELMEIYGENDVPQIWDEMRRRVAEAAQRLPPGTHTPLVEDDYGDVYGILYAIEASGYREAEIDDMSKFLSSRLKQVPGVAKVRTAGEPQEAVHVELDHETLVGLGLPVDAVFASIGAENRVVAAGSVAYGDRRLRVAPELAFDSVSAIADMRIGRPGSNEIIRLGDVARISRSAVEVPPHIIHHNGVAVFTLGVSVTDGQNVVDVGERVDARLAELMGELPVGVEAIPIYRQQDVVRTAINEFLKNLMLSVATVVGALCLFMGWRAGTVVGSVLLLTVLGTIALMAFLGIELQRISLGALMIAMGMLVDNAIVVADGMVVGVQRGMTPKAAAARAVGRTQFPLLGATVIGLLAFAPIGLSDDNSGYFLRSLFQVVALSLLLSWVLAITVVPLLGSKLLRPMAEVSDSLYSGWAYRPYRALVRFGLRRAWLASVIIVAITGACLWGFSFVKQGFFPGNNTPLLYVDYFLPQGTDIQATAAEITTLETALLEDEDITDVTSFIGRGMTRFAATMRPEQPNPAMAQLVVRVSDATLLNAAVGRVETLLGELVPHAEYMVYRSEFTPSGNSKIEARFSGPDPIVLRRLADAALAVYLNHDLVDRKTDWRQRELQIVPTFDEERARRAGITRADVYQSLAFATHGVQIGLFRDRDKLLPIISRAPREERNDIQTLPDRLVWSPTQGEHIPMSQVVSRFDLRPEDNRILRRQRIRTLTAQANAPDGHNVTRVFNGMRSDVEAIPLPPGYSLEWGGEFEGSAEARVLLLNKVPLTFGSMFLITVLMFGRMRQPIVIWLTVPMVVCGVVVSLLVTDLSFTFPSFLGLLSLSGMLIKNCIVLVDEIDKRMAEDGASLAVIEEASVSRLRPVMLAAGTTIAGMSPLLGDAFFLEMAVCIMGGLAFATLLTLLAVPVFYRIALSRSLDAERAGSTNTPIAAV